MARDNQSNVKCPYYKTCGDKYLTCEGFNTEILKQRFKSSDDIEKFQRRNCFKYPNKCVIAIANDEKYAREG